MKIIIAFVLLLILAGCNVDPVSGDTVEAVAKTCEAQGHVVRVHQTSTELQIVCFPVSSK